MAPAASPSDRDPDLARAGGRPIPTYVLVVDERVGAYSPRLGGPGHITEEPGLVGVLLMAFDGAWLRAVPYRRSSELTREQHKVLTLVGLGHNNQTIASALGCHVRTVRRRIDELLDHFGEVERPSLVRHAMLTGD